MLRRYVTAVVGRPKLVIAAVVVVTLVLGFFISRLRVLLDVDQQLPPGHPLVVGRQAHREAVRRQVHDGGRLLFGVGHDLHARHAGARSSA